MTRRSVAGTFGQGVIAVVALILPAFATADTGLQIPRFASLRANEVNLRTGPGRQYPIDWIFRYKSMPVKIIGEYDHWRQVRDWEGAEGWIHKSLLTGRRTAMIVGDGHPLRRSPEGDSAVVARIEGKVVGRLLECEERWCRLEVGGYRGWMRRGHLWGADPAGERE